MREHVLQQVMPESSGMAFIGRAEKERRKILASLLGRRLRAIDAQLCAPGALPVHGIHRILVCRPNHRLGNTVLISPLLRELEALYPGAEIDILGAGCAAETLFGTRFQIRRIVSLPRRIPRHPLRALRLIRSVTHDRYDLAIDACLQSNMGRLLLGACSARYKIGFPYDAEAGTPLASYHHGCPEHFALRNVHLLRVALGCASTREWPRLHVGLDPLELTRGKCVVDAILDSPADAPEQRPVLGIFANATGDKRYPEDWWQDFVATLRERQPDVRIVDILAEHGLSQLPGTAHPFFSRNLRKLAAVLANLDGFISADCGVMHLASAVGTPTLGLFSRDNAAKYAPYGDLNRAIHTHAEMSGAQVAEQASQWIARLHRERHARHASASAA
ncbi:glycosyltransferase family 9 protein [Oleiagrimonas soli]|uniref:ADP-heptose:LPS heptosyltransferase n=1 Tax=Oleiagrimonas soli TaxID=1543381 RepID=A0A841KHV0_9GAMM|nr:glycosyltransferase family 9 protein [Oleiagrimonas soli]MBB6183557.1 ADP-heptose:LPS heptosyltransferase [Oleiagrimonas soli]